MALTALLVRSPGTRAPTGSQQWGLSRAALQRKPQLPRSTAFDMLLKPSILTRAVRGVCLKGKVATRLSAGLASVAPSKMAVAAETNTQELIDKLNAAYEKVRKSSCRGMRGGISPASPTSHYC